MKVFRLAIIASVLLSGCGHTGDLYLPSQQQASADAAQHSQHVHK